MSKLTRDLVAITEADSGSISIDKINSKQNKAEVADNTVENVQDSDSELTDLEDLEDEDNMD